MIHDMRLSPENIMAWLRSEGYSAVLGYSGKRAYLEDEDTDAGVRWIPVAIARVLLATNSIALWRDHRQYGDPYNVYRPTAWVVAWNKAHPKATAQS